MPIPLKKAMKDAAARPRREGNVRPDLWRSIPVLSKAAGSRGPLGRRSFLGLGAALTGGLALGAKAGQAEPQPASPYAKKASRIVHLFDGRIVEDRKSA